MENETNQSQENNVDVDVSAYIEQIQRLKADTVSREQYEKKVAENRQLIESLANNQPSAKQIPEKSSDDLRKELFGGREMTNLEYCEKALALRDAVMREEGKDIFVASGHDLTPTAEAYAAAQRVADVMQDCIDSAEGSPELFTAELMRRTNDVRLPRRV